MESTLALTTAHKAARLAWAKDMVLKSTEEWDCVVFSDEKKFNLDGPDGLQSAKGKTELAVLVGRQASPHYIHTVSEYLLPYAHFHYGVDFVYQQGNASIHTSRETIEFLDEPGVNVMTWPARSLDLNPVEKLWAILARKVYQNGRQYANVAELTQAILQAWKAIEHTALTTLIRSMPRRCIEVIERKGDKTHY
ncbi:unnamed protein product [Phytophthora fragariaefolia]|uniref:Unnamed protein product n=1 Tax=Phytophthora fragariaefolia TaxID=1490495 RepID=A0A9W6TXH9_9STRA|nr:unnamed protein product [Phytophthora fragariaefolia]